MVLYVSLSNERTTLQHITVGGSMKIPASWDMTPCGLTGIYTWYRGACAFIFRVAQNGWSEPVTSSKTLVLRPYQSTRHHILAAWNHHQYRCESSNVEWDSMSITGAVHKFQFTFRNQRFPNAIKDNFWWIIVQLLYNKSRTIKLFLLQFYLEWNSINICISTF